MKNSQILCIDYGSAYTKVALRANWNNQAELIRDVPLAPRDTSFCIPSVVARVERTEGVRWAVGEAAAGQFPGDGVKIYRHWKARLLSDQAADQEGKDLMAAAAIPGSDAREYDEVGVVFFRELKNALDQMRLAVEVDSCPVRLCIPRLVKNAEAEQRMVRILSDSGWHLAENRATLSEPESNACGVFTRGRNWTWLPPHPSSSGRHRYNPNMFDQDGLFRAFRQAALSGRHVRYGVLVIDVGAFTTDFGYVEFDNNWLGDAHGPDVMQLSREIGVRELDRSVYDGLRPDVQNAIRKMTTSAWEIRKRLFYNGQPAAVVNPKGGMFTIGEGAEATRIADTITEFANRVVQARDEFCRDHVKGRIDAEVLTGGGALIPLVRQALVNAMRADRGTRVYDLLDEDEPREALLQKRGALRLVS